MGFLFPLFLIAGLSLAIPVIIHLFNLRKFKRVYFPDNRFLKDILLSTKRQARIRNWRLLLSRLLFLAALVLAFTQPFFDNTAKSKEAAVSVIYIDNSYSMMLAQGQQTLLQQSIYKAKNLINAASENSKFIILTNEHPSATRPMMKREALSNIGQIKPTARTTSLKQIVQSVAAAQANEESKQLWNFYAFSDLQQDAFVTKEKIALPKNVHYFFYPMQEKAVGNLYIDTAYFLSPTVDTRQPNKIVVAVKQSGGKNEKESNLNILVDKQVRAVKTITLNSDTTWTDTLTLQLSGKGWQEVAITLQDHPLSFDDTFRIAARTSPNLAVLVLNDGTPNTFIQAALGNHEGFQIKQESVNTSPADSWNQYSLIILQNISTLTSTVIDGMKKALERGQNFLVFPSAQLNTSAFNQQIHNLLDIKLDAVDTSQQHIAAIQSTHPLLNDFFEKLPENLQMPITSRRYPIDAGLSANQQSLMSFKDGKPFLAQYTAEQGKIYVCASPLDDRSSNFPLSYYFVPILYKMATQAGGNNILAIDVGSNGAVWIPERANDSRKVWHIVKENFDIIPPQRPSGVGVDIYAGKSVLEAGFYQLQNETAKDTAILALNTNRLESKLDYASTQTIEKLMQPAKINWLDNNAIAQKGWGKAQSGFPIWKICIIIALVALALETWLLLDKQKPKEQEGLAASLNKA